MDAATLLTGIPHDLRDELLERYREIARNYIEHRWEPAELNGGKFAEVAYSIVSGAVAESFPARASKPPDFAGACRSLEAKKANAALSGDRSLRVLIPRQLVALYEIRNNRGVGHIGGDVDPNAMDAAAVFSIARWVLAELIRVFHGVSPVEAQATVDALAERILPVVWDVPGTEIRRVLSSAGTASDHTLLLLHTKVGWVSDKLLCGSVEYSRLDRYRDNVLRKLHADRLVEFDSKKGQVHLTPLGAKAAEALLPKD